MKYRIEPKPERKSGRLRRFQPYIETDDVEEVKRWIANPTVKVTARVYGTDGTYWQLADQYYRPIIVSEWVDRPSAMDDCDNIPAGWSESRGISTVASTETDEGRRLIERWKP